MPFFQINFSPNLISHLINLQEDIILSYNYSETISPDNLFYGGKIYYNFEVMAVMKFYYKNIHF